MISLLVPSLTLRVPITLRGPSLYSCRQPVVSLFEEAGGGVDVGAAALFYFILPFIFCCSGFLFFFTLGFYLLPPQNPVLTPSFFLVAFFYIACRRYIAVCASEAGDTGPFWWWSVSP